MRKRAESAIPGWRAAVQQIPVGDAHEPHGGVKSATVPLDIGPEELWVAASGVRFARRHRLHVPRHHRGRAPRPGEDGLRRHGLARAADAARVGLRRRGHAAGALRRARRAAARPAARAPRGAGEPALDDHRRAPAREQARRAARLRAAPPRARGLRRRRGRARSSSRLRRCTRRPGSRSSCRRRRGSRTPAATATRSRRCSPNLVENAVKYSPGGGRDRRRARARGRPHPLRGARSRARDPARRAGADLQEVLSPRSRT